MLSKDYLLCTGSLFQLHLESDKNTILSYYVEIQGLLWENKDYFHKHYLAF